jgi:hypothetical protein
LLQAFNYLHNCAQLQMKEQLPAKSRAAEAKKNYEADTKYD